MRGRYSKGGRNMAKEKDRRCTAEVGRKGEEMSEEERELESGKQRWKR